MASLVRICGADVYTPEPLGVCDVVVGGGAILAIGDISSLPDSGSTIDAKGKRLIPGLVDSLTHPCGGGGEGGFANRTDELPLESFVAAGVTSPVAALGTDSIGRSLDVLYGKVMQLREQGLRAYMYTGAYRIPVPTLTGDVTRDLYLVEPVIGVGEVAIADHRGTQPSAAELRRLAGEANLAGVLLGYGGVVFVHVGDGDSRLARLREALQDSDLPVTAFFPTHVNRSEAHLEEAADWIQAGGYADITVATTPELIALGDIPAARALEILLDAGAAAERITFSSDAGGSLPVYEDGEFKGLSAATPDCLLKLLAEIAVTRPDLYPQAVAAMTANPANALNMGRLGRLREDGLADFLLVDATDGALSHVFCGGRQLQ
ncbi:MAG: amidohydrolase family protein [Pseudomonadota bacterium]